MRKIFYREAVKKARKLLNRKAAGRMIFHTRKIFRMHSRLWKMKKVIAVFISLLMILSLAACGNSASQTGQPSTEEKPAAGTANSEESAENSTDAENTDTSEGQTNEPENPQNLDISEEQGTKVLVAYFSATNTTEGVAEHIVDGLNADIYEIVPEEPYTDADLNYNDNNSRTTIEMNDPDARPAISGSVEDMEQYDIVFIGYPKMEYGFNCVLCA